MERENETTGLIYGILAYITWGVLPLYWKLLEEIPAIEILAYRIFWSFAFVGIILLATGNWKSLVDVCKSRRNIFLIFLCSSIISGNWGIYIWAVNSGQVVEASMGYYINPLVVFVFSVFILKERLNLWQVCAIGAATLGVLILTIQYGKFPWIALTLAVTFAVYGLIKKMINVDAMGGLALETAIIAPLALLYIIFRQVQGIGALGSVSIGTLLILLGSGVVTASPLLWFAQAARKLKFSTLGFLQYIAPTLSLFLGVIIFKEPFTSTHFFSFGFIWLGLVIYTLSNVGVLKNKLYHNELAKETTKP
ncbi:MAG: EamA family transporter RarD [Peptococcales bacterium]|jgi:chloramphenicol-sensitive protein RarD